nr:hypothetical protein [Propylenella binzhouense]
MVADIGEVHVGGPVDEHEQSAEEGAEPREQTEQQRQPDEEMAVADQEGHEGGDRGGGERRVESVEGLRAAEEAGDGELRIEDLVRGRVEERPGHGQPQKENEAAVEAGIGHRSYPFRS